MQNLSLQVTQTTPVKGVSDATSKKDGNADKSGSAEPNNAFQMLLSRQVLAKKAQDTSNSQLAVKQSAAKPSPTKQVTAEQAATANNTVAVESKADAIARAASSATNKTETDAATVIAGIQAELDAKGVSNQKDKADSKAEDAAMLAADASSLGMTAPIINAIPLVNTQNSAATTDAQLATATEAKGPQQQSLDTALNNALSQSKAGNVQDKDGLAKAGLDKDALDIQGDKSSAENARWLDVMVPNASKQAGNEAANAKLMLNAISESAAKDNMVPTSFQAAAPGAVSQINADMAAQQIGSSNLINAYPGKTGWDQAISQKVMWMVGNGEQSASLTLNPPDMGPLQVVISVNNDKADTTFISDNPEVRKALEDGMANLRDKMNESGIQLGQANVSSGGQAQQEFQQAAQSRMNAQRNVGNAVEPAQTASSATATVRVSNGLVDTFA